jgi:hypothetical protein
MSSLFRLFGTKSPAYNKKYKEKLFERFTIQGGSTEKKTSHGAFFETNYEFLLYGFFLGFYQNIRLELPGKSDQTSFRHEIENWGSKRHTDFRRDFKYVQFALFEAAFLSTDIDWIGVERGDVSIETAVGELITTVEEYANAGFEYLLEKVEERTSTPDEMFFLRLITEAKK